MSSVVPISTISQSFKKYSLFIPLQMLCRSHTIAGEWDGRWSNWSSADDGKEIADSFSPKLTEVPGWNLPNSSRHIKIISGYIEDIRHEFGMWTLRPEHCHVVFPDISAQGDKGCLCHPASSCQSQVAQFHLHRPLQQCQPLQPLQLFRVPWCKVASNVT